MKILVDSGLCEGNGVCVGLAPGLFRLDGGGRLHVHDVDAPTAEQRNRATRAVRYCPKGALRIVEGDTPTDQSEERSQP